MLLARVAREVARHSYFETERALLAFDLEELYRTLPLARFLDTIPFVSPVQHAILLGYLGDPRRYDRASCLISRAGTDPQENFSGLGAGPTAISHRGHGRLREVLTRIVMGLRLRMPHYRSVYEHLRRRAENPLKHTQAQVALGNRYLRLIYRLCVDAKPFDPARLHAERGPRSVRRSRRSS